MVRTFRIPRRVRLALSYLNDEVVDRGEICSLMFIAMSNALNYFDYPRFNNKLSDLFKLELETCFMEIIETEESEGYYEKGSEDYFSFRKQADEYDRFIRLLLDGEINLEWLTESLFNCIIYDFDNGLNAGYLEAINLDLNLITINMMVDDE